MKKSYRNFSTKAAVIISVLLFALNLTVSILLLSHAKASSKRVLEERMLDISDTAASMINGDTLGGLAAKDKETTAYKQIQNTLGVFLNRTEAVYMYCLRPAGSNKFVFTVDSEVKDHAEFGQEAVSTDALFRASRGESAVDDEPYKDAWGEFYSAYTPVFNSQGKVSGIVAADFTAKWVEDQLVDQTAAILIVGMVSIVAGAGIVFLLTRGLHRNYKLLFNELSSLSEDVEDLTDQIADTMSTDSEEKRKLDRMISEEGKKYAEDLPQDEIGKLSAKVRLMRNRLRAYITFAHQQAFVDSMTGAKNKTAYLETVKDIETKILKHSANFSVAVFDINGLKATNDNYGHEYGDRLIKDSCAQMQKVFGKDCIYRIGGDEFIAVMEDTDLQTVKKCFAQIDKALAHFNESERGYEMELAFSKGAAEFDPETDTRYRHVFKRADQEMYADKAAYYMNRGDRRKE